MNILNEQMRFAQNESDKNEIILKLIDRALREGKPLQAVINMLEDEKINGVSMLVNSQTNRNEVREIMTKTTQTEENRISDLESIRMPENTHLIDAAIQSGKTAGEVALKMLSDDRKSDAHATEIAREIKELTLIQNGRPLVTSQKKADTKASAESSEYLSTEENENADAMLTEISALRNQK
jgi:hypothetical protein